MWGHGVGWWQWGPDFGVLFWGPSFEVMVWGPGFGVMVWGGDFGVPPALSAVSPYRWVREFLNDANKGLDVLVNYLSFAQCAVM